MSTRRWLDWVNVVLGLWLMASPWFLSWDAREQSAAWNVWIVGGGLVALAGASMYKATVIGDALGIMVGVWLLATPWMFGLVSLSSAATNALIVGILVSAYALWAMRIDTTPPGASMPAWSTLTAIRDGST